MFFAFPVYLHFTLMLILNSTHMLWSSPLLQLLSRGDAASWILVPIIIKRHLGFGDTNYYCELSKVKQEFPLCSVADIFLPIAVNGMTCLSLSMFLTWLSNFRDCVPTRKRMASVSAVWAVSARACNMIQNNTTNKIIFILYNRSENCLEVYSMEQSFQPGKHIMNGDSTWNSSP